MWYLRDSLTPLSYRQAKKQRYSTVMIAFSVPDSLASKIRLDREDLEAGADLTESGEMHLTLCILKGNVTGTGLKGRQSELTRCLKRFAAEHRAVSGKISGVGRFRGYGDKDPLYASVDCPDLPEFRQALVRHLETCGFPVEYTHGYTPHITLAYLPVEAKTPTLGHGGEAVILRSLSISWAGDWESVSLGKDY